MTEEVMFQTQDKVLIFGNWVEPPGAIGAALLLHMMPADKSSWDDLQRELEKRRIASLAIDLRGHGQSTSKGSEAIDYKEFTDTEHQDSLYDIESSLQFLRKNGFGLEKVAIIGASIGANLALQTAASNRSIPAIVLLSPGENYRGIETFPIAKNLNPNQAILASGSSGDDQASFDAAEKIIELAPSREKRFIPLTSAGHGTNMFAQQKQFPEGIASWVEDQLEKKEV